MSLLTGVTRALFPTVLVFSLYLLLVGHYGPGGGFAAGLVAGLAFVLRHIATGSAGLRVRPPAVAGTGLAVALLTALAPAAFGAPVLSTTKLAADLPLLGPVSVQTSLFLDAGVYLLIVGVVADLLRSLGTGIERDMRDAGER